MTITIGGNEFAIPGGMTEEIKLSKILKVEEGELIRIDPETGDYYLWREDAPSSTNIWVDGFTIDNPHIAPLKESLVFHPNTRANNTYSAQLPEDSKTTFELTTTLPQDIKSLSLIDVSIDGSLTMSFKSNILKKINLQEVDIIFPSFLISPSLTKGVYPIRNIEINNQGNYTINFNIDAINIDPSNLTPQPDGSLMLQLMGEIRSIGTVTANKSDIISGGNITAELISSPALSNIVVTGIRGVVKPNIDVTAEPIVLNDLPDYLTSDKVRLDMKNPMIFIKANNQTPVGATINGTITSNYTASVDDVSVNFNIPNITGNADQQFCLSPINPNIVNTQWIEVSELPSLITRIPQSISLDLNSEATDNEVSVELNKNYTLETEYKIQVPFVFGDQLNIVYTDTMDGWHNDIKKYSIKKIHATGYAINKIPLNIDLTAIAVKLNEKNERVPLEGVKVTVFVNDKENGIIPFGNITEGSKTPIMIEILEVTPNAIKQLDGLILDASANSQNVAEGVLNENQTFQLTNVKLKVPGGLTIDLNE